MNALCEKRENRHPFLGGKISSAAAAKNVWKGKNRRPRYRATRRPIDFIGGSVQWGRGCSIRWEMGVAYCTTKRFVQGGKPVDLRVGGGCFALTNGPSMGTLSVGMGKRRKKGGISPHKKESHGEERGLVWPSSTTGIRTSGGGERTGYR